MGSFRIHSLGNTDLVKSLTGSESSSYCLLNCFRIVVQILDIFTFVVLGSKDVIPRSINNTHLSKGKIQYKENYRNAMGKLSLSFRFISILLGALVKSQLQQNWSRCGLLLTIRYSMSLLIYFTWDLPWKKQEIFISFISFLSIVTPKTHMSYIFSQFVYNLYLKK